MKKFSVSLMAVLMLLVCVLAIQAPEAQAATDTPIQFHCKCGNKYSTALTDGEITWKENCTDVHIGNCDGQILQWTKFDLASKEAIQPGNYYLTDNLAADGITQRSSTFVFGTADQNGTFNLDMNGMDLNMNGKSVKAIQVGYNSVLNICNSKTTGGTIMSLGAAGTHSGVALLSNYHSSNKTNDQTAELNLYGVNLTRLEGNTLSAAGAVRVTNGCTFNAYNCTITGGAVTGNAGAIEVEKNAALNLTNVTVNGSTAGGVGGAIYSLGNISLTDCTVKGGEATGNGGNINAAGGNVTIKGGSIVDGKVTGTQKTGGNLQVSGAANLSLTNVTISGGSAYNGGNLYVAGGHTGTLTVKDCIIHTGEATSYGGNVWLGTAAANAEGKLELAGFHGTKIYNGTAASGGSVYTARRLNLVRSTIGYDLEGKAAGAVATDRGGSVFVNDAEMLLQTGSKIGYGTATADGGNVYVTGENGNGKLTVYDQSMIQWGQAVNGGNVYLNNGNVYFGGTADATHDTGCQIVNGQATGNGGNVYVAAGHGNAQGDALIAGGGSNNTTEEGGNIYVAANASFTLKGRSIVRNGKDLPTGQQAGNIYNAGQLNVFGEAKIYGGSTITKSGERNIYCASIGTVTVTDSVNDKGEYVVNESVIRGGLMVNGGKLVLGGSPWIKSNAVGERSLYLFNNTVVDATGLIEGADVEIFDASSTDRKIADVTAEQTWIKDAFRLSEDSTLACVITREIDAEGNVSLWLRPAIAASVETETGVYDYQTTEEAIANCDATQTIILDLKGQEMALNIPGNLKLVDSANDDFTTQTGSFTGTVSGEVYSLVDANDNHYLVVANEGVYTSHRYAVELTHVSLDPAKEALGYKAQVLGDAVVQANVSSVGFNLWVDSSRVITKTTDAKQNFSLRLNNILKYNGGETVVYGNAFAVIGGRTVTSSDYGTTMKDVLQMVNENWASYDATQQTAVKTMCDLYMDTVSGWKLTNMYPVEDDTASAV